MKRTLIAGVLGLALTGAIVGAAAVGFSAPPPLPTAAEQPNLPVPPELSPVAQAVGMVLTNFHYGGAAIDDSRARAWLAAYFDDLDPQRLYFLQSDIDALTTKWVTSIDDDLLSARPTLAAAYEIHARFRTRIDERISTALRRLDKPLDLEGSETVEIDRGEARWAKSAAELDTLWERRLTEQAIGLTLSATASSGEPVDRLRKRYERIRRDAFDVDAADILEVYLAALSGTFDPHSVWMKPASKDSFDIDMQDTLTGIGAVLGSEDGVVVIRELVAGGPAANSGLLEPNDQILAVSQGAGAPPTDLVEMRIDRVVQLIRGKAGTEVVLTIHPAKASDPSETKQVTLVRERVKLSQAAAKGEIRVVPSSGGDKRIGVLDVPSFYVDSEAERRGETNFGSTANDVRRLLVDWKDDKLDGIVVDLRANGGGSLQQALELTGLFLDSGPVVQIRDRAGKVKSLDDPSPGALWTGPVTVLTSELSASASEIFAAALQDYGRALIVGSPTTHGKGSVQELIGLDRWLTRIGEPEAAARAGAIKYTSAMFFRVNGSSTQRKGVLADIVLPSPYRGLKISEADLDAALAWDQVAPATYRRADLRAPLAALQQRSEARVASSEEFRWLAADVAEREATDARNTLLLQLSARRAEVDANKADDAARDAARATRGWKEGDDLPDFLLDEALAVTADWIATAPAAAR